ncbi:MAG: hypothetical protein LC114_06300 [Bryobacterales bacterium]|nr:hypothetical protein [Bryobacterales bacterium]
MIAIADSAGGGDIHFFRYRGVPVAPPGDLHNRGANVVFCDGHVEWQRQGKWIEFNETAARRWHNDNQPHREAWVVGTPPKGYSRNLVAGEGARGERAFRVTVVGWGWLHAGALASELRSNRSAPDFAPLRCATPVGSLWRRSWRGGADSCKLVGT